MKIVKRSTDLHNPSLRYRNTVTETGRASKCSQAGLLDVVIFVTEARRQDGGCYPPNSLFNVVAGVQRYLRNLPQFADVAFISKSSPFSRLRKALDVIVV